MSEISTLNDQLREIKQQLDGMEDWMHAVMPRLEGMYDNILSSVYSRSPTRHFGAPTTLDVSRLGDAHEESISA